MRTHIRDLRLFNNAGISFPVCRASDEKLDLDKSSWPTVAHPKDSTCNNCKIAFRKRYPWAESPEKQVS
jgi:hypothetical protein